MCWQSLMLENKAILFNNINVSSETLEAHSNSASNTLPLQT